MLSVCIPHYNYENPKLFDAILDQGNKLEYEFELLIIDDGSDKSCKEYLSNYNNSRTRIIYLETNRGRSFVRNLLAKEAKYKNLLFLDADSAIIKDDFLEKYLNYTHENIVSGGRCYDVDDKENKHFLHWRYGTEIESNSKVQFHSCNFMIKKEIFEKVNFEERLKNYGYEDVLFGLEAKKLGYKILTFHNPIMHIQIKSNADFLKDVQSSLLNLYKLANLMPDLELENEIKILIKYKQLKKIGFFNMLSPISNKIKEVLFQKLIDSEKGGFFLLNVYKMFYYHSIQADTIRHSS